MQFQVQHSSGWIGLAAILVGCAIAIAIFFSTDKIENAGVVRRRLIICLFVLFLSAGSGFWLVKQDYVQIDASFSKQLMDEYHATSSRSFPSINYDLGPSSGATAVFTRDGKDTPVFIRLINRDGEKITMTFTKLDDQSLYPAASK